MCRKIKAFTVLELLTGMIASAIVIASVFLAAQIVSNMAKRYSDSINNSHELSIFQSRLAADLSGSDTCLISIEEQKFEIIRNSDIIIYHCLDSSLVRQCNAEKAVFNLFARISQEQFANPCTLSIQSTHTSNVHNVTLDNSRAYSSIDIAINSWMNQSEPK
jgi:competence protein ComGF